MKNKPQKHKTSNAFHFKSFRERIDEIDVRRGALYRVETDYELPETEDGTFFQQALVKWSLQNLTDEYGAYQRGFKETATLPLLLFNKEAIVNHLTSCLSKATDDALQPLLELVVALAKDMRKEFRPYFAGLFEVVVQFLYSDSADRVEWTLLCLAHLFKILRSFLRSDFTLTFHRLLPLLDETSSPPHAIDFATECLGYLVRDLKDKEPFVRLMLKCQTRNQALTFACGKLLFEVLHGVQDQFHTTAKQTMQQLYNILQQLDETEADILQDILTQTITDVVERIQAEDIPIFWVTVRGTIDGCLAAFDAQRERSDEGKIVKYLTRLLQLSGIVLEHQYGRLLGDSLSVTVSQLIRLLTSFTSPSIEFKETIVNHIIVLLRSRHLPLTQLEASRLTMNVLLLDHRPLYDRFIEATVQCQMFEALIWPNFVKRLELELDDARMSFLASLLLKKSPLCGNGLKLEDWKSFPVNVVSKGNLETYMKKMMLSTPAHVVDHAADAYLSALIVLPHLTNFRDKTAANNAVRDFIKHGVQGLQNGSSEKAIQLIALAVETIVHLKEMDGKAYFDLLECLLPVVTIHDCLLLNSVHLLLVYITNQRKNLITFDRFKHVHRFVHPLTASYNTTVRQLACAIMATFADLPELASGMGPLYRTMAQIECIEPLIHTYREQVILFQNLTYDGRLCQQAAKVARNEWNETVMRYMLSMFAINFKLLWEPAGTVVQTYADNMVKQDEEMFWTVFDTMLTMAEARKPHEDPDQSGDLNGHEAANEETPSEASDNVNADEEMVEESPKSRRSLFPTVMEHFPKKPNIDYMNVRIQQLRMLHRCTNFCRSKGDRIVERFFVYLEQDKTNSNLTTVGNGEEPAEENVAAATSFTTVVKRKSSQSAGAGTHQVLLSYLRICTELTPKVVRKHSDRLYATYETLVSSRNEEIQKVALTGIFTLGGSQLTPYKDFINRLTSEKTLKQALLSVFVPSEEDDTEDAGYTSASGRTKVAEEHRPKVLQLVLKVLDGKIKQNLGNGGTGGQHKATILTFIGRLRVEELDLLLHRWYEVYLKQLKDTPTETVRFITAALDDGIEVVPTPTPFKVKTLLNFLAALQTEIAPIKSPVFAAKLMHLKICFDALLMRMDHSIYRKYKNQALLALVELFDQYDSSYQWTDDEMAAIMLVHVWPQLEHLPSDSIHSPTPLLKLLLSWSQSNRFYTLLERRCDTEGDHHHQRMDTDEAEPSMTPLDAMINLLRGSQTSASVCRQIFTALAGMLEEDGRNRTDSNEPPLFHGRSRLLIPYVKDLLQYIRQAIKGKKVISSDLLLILTRLAESGMIGSDQKDEERNENDRVSLLNMLFPILARKVSEIGGDGHQQASEDVRRLHIIIARLLSEVREPLRYLKQLALCLQNVKDRAARKIVYQIFESFAHRSAEMKLINTLVHELNAMDKRWVEQPDHAARTTAYRSIDQLLARDAPEGKRMTGNVAIVFLSQAFHVLQFEKDFSARQNATEYVCKVVLYLASANEWSTELDYCLDRIVLHSIIQGFKIKRTANERRNESILLLGELARMVGKPGVTTHPQCRVFAELWHFTAQGDGAERDFFENITHLQTYKHRKAMRRLAVKLSLMAEAEPETDKRVIGAGGPSARTTVNFLLPIVSHYICHDEYKKLTNLVEEAGNCIINLCRLLPWRGYHMVLHQYLRKLKFSFEYQKQLLRIVIGIMDAFHFDLSAAINAGGADETSNNPVKVAVNSLMDTKLTLKRDTDGNDEAKEDIPAKAAAEQEKQMTDKDGEEEKEAENGEQEVKEEAEDEEVMIEEVVEDEPTKDDPALALRVAREIVHDISKTIIPNLLSSFNFATEAPVSIGSSGHVDKKARFAKQRTEMLKLPIAIAIVKLFMKLPRKEIELNLPKLIIKVITFLKSRLKLARVQARNTLAHITLELGPSYISFVLQNLLAMLTRGFQRHVLTFTVHTIIERAQKHLDAGSVLENILQTVVHICAEDIFGQLIGLMNGTTIETGSLRKNSMPESKSTRKPYKTLYILARYAQERMLVDLFTPFRAILSKYRTHQTVAKVHDALHQIAEGIVANKSIRPDSLLVFVYGLVTGRIYAQCAVDETDPEQQQQTADADGKQPAKKLLGAVPKPGSIYIIPEEPKRYGSAAGTTTLDHILAKTEGNDPAFLECGLEILLSFIRREQFGKRHDSDEEKLLQQLVDPIVPTLVDSLDSKHSKIICHSINCFTALWSTEWSLKSFEQPETVDKIVKAIFTILHRYNTVALDINNPNFGMVRASFRAIVAILKHGTNTYNFSQEQLRLLVMYIEQDLAVGGGRQTTAFVLLRALLARRFTFNELHALMSKVFELCVQSDSDTVRAECRENIVEYIMNFPTSKKVHTHLWFFVSQLEYPVLHGRESACLVLKRLFQKLPKATLVENHAAIFLVVGLRLTNDDATEIRTLAADCIETLLKRLDTKDIASLVVPLQEMLCSTLLKQRELATQLLLRILQTEPKDSFISSWLDKVLPSLLQNLVPQANNATDATQGKFVKPLVPITTLLLHGDPWADHLIIQTLNFFQTVLRLYPALLTTEQYNDTVDSLAYTVQSLLSSAHQWVRIGALKVLHQIMNELDYDAIHERIKYILKQSKKGRHVDEGEMDTEDIAPPSSGGKQFLYGDPLRDCKTLTLDLCAQLTPNSGMVSENDDEAAALVTQLLFLIANVLRAVPLENEKMSSKKINLYWLVRRVRYVMQSEIVQTPHVFTLRKHALHWLSSVIAIVEQETLVQLAPSLLIPAVRELTAQDVSGTHATNDPSKIALRKVATKVGREICARLGTEQYDKIRNAIEVSLRRKRTGRRVKLAQEKINQPILAARRKEAKKMRTKEARKRKMADRDDPLDIDAESKGGVIPGVKHRAPSKKRSKVPKKRRNMESMFRE
ncbi:small subunit processome component 20 homolog [Anopheles maculipalpis]|uniref:small subunit processome component 20 homolog n=1 Tax=Anopheles maculipalpis TaxID=1496333 RepID=UPI0021591FFC|nr:small subunit processome component 20 homolog [Anopheles maculipalpis]